MFLHHAVHAEASWCAWHIGHTEWLLQEALLLLKHSNPVAQKLAGMVGFLVIALAVTAMLSLLSALASLLSCSSS